MLLDQKSPGQRLWALIGSEGCWLLLSDLELTEQLRVSAAAFLKTPRQKQEPGESSRLPVLTSPGPENPVLLIRPRLEQITSPGGSRLNLSFHCCSIGLKEESVDYPACLRSHCGHKNRNKLQEATQLLTNKTATCVRTWQRTIENISTSAGSMAHQELWWLLGDLLDFSGSGLVKRWEERNRIKAVMLPTTLQLSSAATLLFDQPHQVTEPQLSLWQANHRLTTS